MNKEKLTVWEPIKTKDNQFSRLYNELVFFEMHYQKDFVLVFEDTDHSKKYIFTYDYNKSQKYAIITFRLFDEMTRPDIEELISKVGKEREEEGLSKLTYEPNFYKVENSSFLSWYDNIFPARASLQPKAEHHLYITSDYIIDVLSEYDPTVAVEFQ
ncbi:hypothetical protein [Psychrobacillus sp. FJAT-21963]|uniref:hypothetical protein n=1 Tax=Psychrobacillus sp. FJAT-21963 TaxID=1712028 RepID=UPI0006F68843|nr:hypothetical protein [Psychrobacillus sp. FJAT-21963]KQL36097.1 hypothetical protein AN959_09480 [Psychrobacillus sp. FJAT-21963]